MPDALTEIVTLPDLRATLSLVAAALAGWGAQALLFAILRRLVQRTPTEIDDHLVRRCAGPLRLGLPLLAVAAARPAVWSAPPAALTHGLQLAGIFVTAWLLARGAFAAEDTVLGRLDLGARDNLRARRLQTQMRLLRRTVGFAIWVVAAGTALLSFDTFRQVGAGLLTSAGVAGIVLGLAAQRTLGSVFAGIQIAITQPIRLDDVVIVEGEWGRIEEITLTYVVVKIWDERRLVVPIEWFLTNPFQNWTRTSADLLGTVYLKVDATIDLDALRDAVKECVERSAHWDGRLWRLHVTDANGTAIEARALMSAADSDAAWELRCEVREALVRFVAERHPEALPRLRAELDGPKQPGGAPAAALTPPRG